MAPAPSRPASIPVSTWKSLTPYAQKVLDNTNQLSKSTRTAEQQRVWDMALNKPAPVRGAPPGAVAPGPRPGTGPRASAPSGVGSQNFLPGSGLGAAGAGHPEGNANAWPELFGLGADAYPYIADVMDNPAMLSKALQAAGFSGGLDQMLRDAMLSQAFAGREQFVQNSSGNTGAVSGNPALQDVRTSFDRKALEMILGTIQQEVEAGRNPAALFQARAQFTPAWGKDVLNARNPGDFMTAINEASARGSSAGFDMTPLMSAGINIMDPSKPLFGAGSHPPSLMPFTGFQSGEEAAYRTMSAPEFLMGPGAIGEAYFNRSAGAPAPFGPMQFGSPELVGVGPGGGGVYARSPIQYTPEYARWSAWGQPRPPDNNREGVYAGDFTPDQAPHGWQGWAAPYAPGTVDPNFVARIMALIGLAVPGGGGDGDFIGGGGGLGDGPSAPGLVPLDPYEDFFQEEEF